VRYSPKLEAILASASGRISGLDPKTWIIVEPGISREEVKEYFLSREIGFVSSAIQDVAGLCRGILGPLVDPKRVLGPPSRQEVLRRILADRPFSQSLGELRRLKRQRDFYKKLDRSIQAARMTYISPLEREAQEERLRVAGARGVLRVEVARVIEAYEEWLSENRAWDGPRLILGAIGVLSSPDVELVLPERVIVLSAKPGESRGEAFWETLANRVEIERVFVSDLGTESAKPPASAPRWEEWHTVDDCCDRIADALLEASSCGTLEENGVLLPDLPAVRRSLKRALTERGLELKDPRDPTRLRWEESVKTALLPLEVVARRYRHEDVISFLHSSWVRIDANPEVDFREKKKIHQEILDRGIRMGLESYSGDRLERVRAILELLQTAFSPRVRIEDVAGFHLSWIKRNEDFEAWVHEFFEGVWERFAQDLAVIGDSRKSAPILYWLERLRLRIQDATPPFEKIQYERGVEIFRLGQTPLRYPPKLWCLALPPRYTTGETGGDYYFSDREREILAGHFPVRSQIQEAETRRKVLKLWLEHADEVVFLDAIYDWDGRERESIEPLLEEMGVATEPVRMHSHPRWSASYLHPKRSAPRKIELPPMDVEEIRASDIEAFSRCQFLGLALGRWRLRDAKTSDLDLRGDSRGTLLHEAVKVLVESRHEDGSFGMTAEEAVDAAWAKKRPKGLFQGERLTKFTKRKLLPVLEAFMHAEIKYVKRSGTKVLALEEPKLRYVVDLGVKDDGTRKQVAIVGVPDRIDEHPEGIFIIDYKSGADSPTAAQMVDLGYRLQLPIYALAAENHYGKPAIGVQFVTLNRGASRSRGVFFSRWNGKTAGSLTEARANNTSIVDREPNAVWGDAAAQIESHIAEYLSGKIAVEPKQTKPGVRYAECEACFVRDACGQRRFLDDREDEEGSDGAAE
jgi:RecB family exonuclease